MFYQLRRAYYFIECSLAGESPSMKRLRLALWNNVFTHDMAVYARHLWNRMEDFSTLLLGETGTGKGAAATAIGRSGFIPFDPRQERFTVSFTKSFLAVNLSQFSEALIESELFGHRKGAFTGAVSAHEGVFSRCSKHGAIFLDEIGEVSAPVQIKLLKVLEERTFSPVGSHESRRFHGRVIAAGNRSLRELRDEGRFRADFYYRLCSDVIQVPPLRERLREEPRELGILTALIVQRILGHDAPELAQAIKVRLAATPGADYAWPGNVRELEQAVRRILLTRRYAGDLPVESGDAPARLAHDIEGGTCTAHELVSRYCGLLYDRHGTYEAVARLTGLDRRTVKKHVAGAAVAEKRQG
jgi:transcriptional regulator with GAF, ATPase, and Fis domain